MFTNKYLHGQTGLGARNAKTEAIYTGFTTRKRDAENRVKKLSDAEDEFWVVPARNANKLLNAPRFSAVVVSASGHMAHMNTVHPTVFMEFKRWLRCRTAAPPSNAPVTCCKPPWLSNS